MKPQIEKLRIDQEVWAIVEERLEGSEVLVNFAGDLLRIHNDTTKNFRAGERICLKVQSIEPLKFKLISPVAGRPRPKTRFDISI
jgi:hypothetical protein